jgi:PAS domain S-box-containing protein
VREYYEWQINRISLPEGGYGVVCYFRDISRQVLAREAIAESEERLRFMAESMPQKIFTAKPNGDIDYFNRQWTEFTGLSFEQIKNWGWTQFIHPDDLEENVRRWRHSVDTGEPFQLEHRFRRADGVYCWHLSRAYAMRDANGNVLMWIGSNTDIDDIKRVEEALRQKSVEADEANRMKSVFVANVSHDLRTPLNAIIGYNQLLLSELYGPLPDRQRIPLHRVTKNSRELLKLINNVLDFSKMESGKSSVDTAPVELSSLIKELLDEMMPLLDEKSLSVQCKVPDALPSIESDATKIKQILTNLLSNAIKFTDKGGITIQAEDRPERSGIEVAIQDTGIGIRKEELSRIFESFYQVNLARSIGTGLGLKIVEDLVHLLKGEITVQSEYGEGSTFAVFLPYRSKEEDALP